MIALMVGTPVAALMFGMLVGWVLRGRLGKADLQIDAASEMAGVLENREGERFKVVKSRPSDYPTWVWPEWRETV